MYCICFNNIFGIPVVTVLFDNGAATLPANIFNIPYRIFLYSLGFIVMSKPIKAAVVIKGQTGADFIVDTKLNTDGYVQIKSEMKVIKRENLIKNVKQIF